MVKRFPDRLRFWEPDEITAGRRLEAEDFAGNGLSADQIAAVLEDTSLEGIDRRQRIYRLGEALRPMTQGWLAVPPEHQRLFENEGGPLNAPLPMTGRSIFVSAFESPAEFDYAEDHLRSVCADIGSWLDA